MDSIREVSEELKVKRNMFLVAEMMELKKSVIKLGFLPCIPITQESLPTVNAHWWCLPQMPEAGNLG